MSANLTKEDIELIKKMWKIPSTNLYDTGDVFLYKFFEKYPSYKDLFPKFRNTPLEDLKGSPAFRSHAYRIMIQFTTSINLLGTENGLEVVKQIWRSHGELHSELNVSRQQFMEMRDVIISVLLELCNLQHDQDVKVAWQKLFKLVYGFSFETMFK